LHAFPGIPKDRIILVPGYSVGLFYSLKRCDPD
jgi:hypothetical protein